MTVKATYSKGHLEIGFLMLILIFFYTYFINILSPLCYHGNKDHLRYHINTKMNSRDYKLFRPGSYYHVYNRGVNREKIFLDEQDFLNFLKRIKIVMGILQIPDNGRRRSLRLKALPINSFDILSYCLMDNHFHLLIKQNANIPIGQLINKICNSYAKYFNRKYERIGNIFQDIFKAKLVENDLYLTYLSAYIHNNPTNPLFYPYSSFPDYINNRNGQICKTQFILGYFNNAPENYKNFVLQYGDKENGLIKDLIFEE